MTSRQEFDPISTRAGTGTEKHFTASDLSVFQILITGPSLASASLIRPTCYTGVESNEILLRYCTRHIPTGSRVPQCRCLPRERWPSSAALEATSE